jgi:hypothetical protein
MEIVKKICRKCQKEYPLNHFGINLKYKDGHKSWCFACYKQYSTMKSKLFRQSLTEDQKKEKNAKRRLHYQENRESLLKYKQTDKALYTNYKSEARRRKRKIFDLKFDDFKKLINSNCTYCNVSNCRGIDRIDNNIGYVLENSTPCCHRCNRMKSDLSVPLFLAHIKKIYESNSPF